MTATYQSGYSNQDVNNMVRALRPQEVLNSIFVPTGKPIGLPQREGKRQSLQTGSSYRNPITISSTASSSPSLLSPAVLLSTSTLFQSDFLSDSDRYNASYIRQDDPSRTNTSQPHGHLIPGSSHDAYLVTLAHKKASLPQVEDASKHLQQIMGLRNEEAFRAPVAVRSGQEVVIVGSAVDSNPALRHLRNSNTGLGIHMDQAGTGRGLGHGRTNWEAAEKNQRDNGERALRGQQRIEAEKPLTLRESLLLHGRQPYGNQVKTELRSLTFHDLTPDVRNGGFKNEMLAHFEADQGGRTRLVSYHVDVPVNEHQQPIYSSNGVPLVRTERWFSFLISTPFVSFKTGLQPSLPPNLPSQNGHPPSSWLVFAAPERAIISHLPCKDNIVSHNPSGAEVLRPVNRYDYDFSHNGVPAFEFMDKSSIIGDPLSAYLTKAVAGPFLCGKGVEAYEGGGEDFIIKPREQNKKSKAKTAATSLPAPAPREKGEGEEDGSGNNEEEDDDEEEDPEALAREDTRRWDDVENWEQEMANSCWWNDAQAQFLEDRHTWARIKYSMARGCCRVVVRVEDGAQNNHQPQSRTPDRYHTQSQTRNQTRQSQGQNQQPQQDEDQDQDQGQDQGHQQQQQRLRDFQDSWTARRRRRMGRMARGMTELQ